MGIAATDPVPQNGAFTHNRAVMRSRALAQDYAHVRPWWRPRQPPPDDIEPPF